MIRRDELKDAIYSCIDEMRLYKTQYLKPTHITKSFNRTLKNLEVLFNELTEEE